MSIILDLESPTKPVCSWRSSVGRGIEIGHEEVGLRDFLCLAHYVLTNVDLTGPDDPRLHFVQCVRTMREADGHNAGGRRLEATMTPIPRIAQVEDEPDCACGHASHQGGSCASCDCANYRVPANRTEVPS